MAEGELAGHRILALKPLTYMNASGDSVQAAAAFFKVESGDITALHDELDLAPGRVRVKKGGGAAGHNGCARWTACWARRTIGGCGSASAIPARRSGSTGTCWAISPRWTRNWLGVLLDAVADAAPLLAAAQPEPFMTRVALLVGS